MVSKSISTVNDQKCLTIITELRIWEEHSVQVNLVHDKNPTMKQFPHTSHVAYNASVT